MLVLRYGRKVTIRLIALIVLLLAADTLFGVIAERRYERQEKASLGLNVQAEKGTAGHNTIGIDERSLRAGDNSRFLHFSTLAGWDFSLEKKTPCPASVKSLDGSRFDCMGFMYPLQTGEKIREFCLLRSTQTCCYGPRPQFNQYVLVEMKEPVKFERLSPVMVSGRFFVDPRPEDGYIYRMEADAVMKAGDDLPDIDPVASAKKAGLPLFNYAPLAAMANRSGTGGVPEDMKVLDGRRVVLAGYCVSRNDTRPPRLIVARAWWDGVGQGIPPTVYNAVAVFPADIAQVPPLWKPYQVFTGTLKLTKDPSLWARDGILQLHDARIGVPGVTRAVRAPRKGPFIPLPWKVCLLAATFVLLVRRRRRDGGAVLPDTAPERQTCGVE